MKYLDDLGTQPASPKTYPVGYYKLHPDVSMNFQMNRWYGWVGEPDMLEEMQTVAPRIAN